MLVKDYIENGFKYVGLLSKSSTSSKKHKTDIKWTDDFHPEGRMGVYIIAVDDEVLKIGETQNMRDRFSCYESHTGQTNVMVRESMEWENVYPILFLECPSLEVTFGGVKVPTGINYRILEKKLIEQYVGSTGSLPKWNKGIQ